jgi:hypothetical protein
MELDTEASSFSTRITVRNVEIRGFFNGIVFGTRAYISQFYSCAIIGNWDCIVTRTGTVDAGENIVFYGCTITAANRGIFNPENMNLRFNNCSIDYLPIVYEGGGLVVIDGGWIEKRFNNTTHLPFNVAARGKPWFDIYENGSVHIIGSTLMQVTATSENDLPQEEYLFFGRNKFSRVELEIQGFNLRTTTGEWMGGSGTIFVHRSRSGQGNKLFNIIPKRDVFHDLLGGSGNIRADRSTLDFPAWIVPQGAYSTYTASTGVTYLGTGNGTLSSVVTTKSAKPGAWKVIMTATGGTGTAFRVQDPVGRVDGTGVIGTRYVGGIEFNSLMPVSGAVNHAVNDTWTVSVADDYLRNIVGLADNPRRTFFHSSGERLKPTR